MKTTSLVIGAAALVLFRGPCSAAEYSVGVHYYPWYGNNNFHSPENIISAIRWYLLPAQQPTVGWYDSHDPAVISAHYLWARGAGIDFFICSYWGQTDDCALTVRDYMLPHPDLGDLKLCVMLDGNPTVGPITKDNVASEISWLCDNLFAHPGYYRIDGKPVVMAYDVLKLSNADLATYCTNARNAAASKGYQVYLVGDEAYGNLPRSSPTTASAARCANFDAVMSYNQYSMLRAYGAGKYASQSHVNSWDSNNGNWRTMANSAGVSYFPCVEPGFNDSEVRGNHHTAMSRKLGSDAGSEGSLFSAQLDKAKTRSDRSIILVTTWNEWHEDTQIEPCIPAGAVTSTINTSLPYVLMQGETGSPTTGGLNYVGYNTTYLDILRTKTSDVPTPPVSPSNPSSTGIGTDTITWTWQDNSANETGFCVFADPGSAMPATLRTTTAANTGSWAQAGLTGNTLYSFQVYAVNGVSPSLRSPLYSAVTLADAPAAGQNVASDRLPGQFFQLGTAVTFSNPTGFGSGGAYMVSGFQYAWDTSPQHTWTGSESTWDTGTLALTLATNGDYYLHLRSVNQVGAVNHSALDYGPFRVDSVAPTGSFVINSGDAYTNSASVTLTLSATDNLSGVSEMRLVNAGGSWSAWEPYSPTRNWSLASGEGTKTVYAQFRDAAGNISVTASDTIVVDITPPGVPGIPTDSGAFCGTSVVFDWTGATDARSGIAGYNCQIGTGVGVADVFDGFVSNSLTRTVSGSLGLRYYCRVQAQDGAGNTGSWSVWSDGVSVVAHVLPDIAGAKALAADDSVGLSSMVVTAVFADRFYIQDASRTSGMMIKPVGGMPTGLAIGSVVSVGGPVRTGSDGERWIEATVSLSN